MTTKISEGPKVETRREQPYVAIPLEVEFLDWDQVRGLIDEVYKWLKHHKIEAVGEPFYRYWVIGGIEEEFNLEVGVPIERMVSGDEHVITGFIPGGNYATAKHKGHPDYLEDSLYALEQWAVDEGLELDKRYEGDTEIWNGRFEFYLDKPGASRLEEMTIEIAFLLMRDDAA
ncbi:GyrI-like domain-containing protein [Planomicrobium sp. Y74]|uniref:GyrI-like domain-containing protein n=1 Tax=Planomicrobium sp. Y74 TaxID=2478977 RepID=UPI000EF4E1CF|nr:GyrI-like domain-containing protein [Planomicrobium sp. Y74]RLQ86618.1 AraC family transcriptional regulator [Planomicrobium sp. Y74]